MIFAGQAGGLSISQILHGVYPERNEDPDKELSFNGVFMLRNGEVTLIDSTLSWPNGIALSPDERYLYVANFEGNPGSDRQ